jgi:lipopolysaccharide/colanic/teichoic acid biosynthesis glycosyltransferase
MNLVIIHRHIHPPAGSNQSLIQSLLQSEPIARLACDGLATTRLPHICADKTVYAIPEEWDVSPFARQSEIITYHENVSLSDCLLRQALRKRWVAFSNGRFATQINTELLGKILAETQAQVLTINARSDLMACREKVRLTAEGKVAGFRRLYCDSVEPALVPADWPAHTFVRTDILHELLVNCALPDSFAAFLQRCRSGGLILSALGVGGIVFDLETEEGLLNFCWIMLEKARNLSRARPGESNVISPSARLIGKVLLGKDVHIGPNAIVVGPTIIGDNVKIEGGALVDSSIICRNVRVQANQFVQNRALTEFNQKTKGTEAQSSKGTKSLCAFVPLCLSRQVFRTWPWFSYAGNLKRVADILAAMMVLILFAPVMPFIALAIKLTSPGPVFFRDKRQGLHGKSFNCLKFRTMQVGSGQIQDKLRIISQVDGPQFKIADDPRISTVGRFLRNTYIDEIPQFLNVLLGQMSVVGPRPSPESENTLCPWWRDARLSVRPGITGLWQVCRTRQPGKDFQEWIHYDTEYVRNLSLRTDLWICWQTLQKMVRDFIKQF